MDHTFQTGRLRLPLVRVLRRDGLLIVVATRSGAPDHYFRWKYRYRPYAASSLLEWLTEAGLDNVRAHELSGIARLFARAYVGSEAVGYRWHVMGRVQGVAAAPRSTKSWVVHERSAPVRVRC